MAEDRHQKPKLAKRTKKNEKLMPFTSPSNAKPAVHDLIGQKLRAYYDEVTKLPVPDRFAELLNQLELKTQQKKSD